MVRQLDCADADVVDMSLACLLERQTPTSEIAADERQGRQVHIQHIYCVGAQLVQVPAVGCPSPAVSR